MTCEKLTQHSTLFVCCASYGSEDVRRVDAVARVPKQKRFGGLLGVLDAATFLPSVQNIFTNKQIELFRLCIFLQETAE